MKRSEKRKKKKLVLSGQYKKSFSFRKLDFSGKHETVFYGLNK